MPREFRLPDLGSGLQEGQIVKWLVEVGQSVTTSDDLCVIETEKTVIEIPVPFTGTVVELSVKAGESAAVGSVIATFSDAENSAGSKKIEEKKPGAMASTMPVASVTTKPVDQPSRAKGIRCATPVRKLARETGIDLEILQGTGRNGRITRANVMASIEAKSAGSSPIPPQTQAAPSPLPGSFEKFSMIRKTISKNMARSWSEIPHVFTRIEVDATDLLNTRKALGEKHGKKIPLEAILISACLPALIKYPYFNASLKDDGIQLHDSYNIGIAADTPSGLVIPVVKDVQDMSFRKLVDTLHDLLPRVVNRKAKPAELTGATFSVNNIGAAGHLMGTSIIPLGTTGILSVGRAVEKPIAKNGMLGIAPMMEVTLSFDHRAIDGGLAQKFMADIAGYLGNPSKYLLAESKGND